MTLRRYLSSVYDWTGIASLINKSKGWHIATLSFAAAFVLLLTVLYHISVVKMPFSDFASTSMGLTHMFPTITYFTLAVILIPLLILVSNAFRMVGFIASGNQNGRTPISRHLSQVKTFLIHFFTYKKMAECPTGKSRWLEHLFVGIGCLIMLAVKIFGLGWFQTDQIHPVFHPQRWLGYLATALLLYGTGSILLGRIKKEKEVYKSSEFADWTFPVLLFATTLSGIILHTLRLLGFEVGTCYTYAIHIMMATPMLVIEMPFGKWTHMIYRPLAVCLQPLKERTLEQPWSSKEVTEYVT